MSSLDDRVRPANKRRPTDGPPKFRGIIPYRTNDVIRERVKTYLGFVAAVRRRIYLISAEGYISEFDFDGFIRNRSYVSPGLESYLDFNGDDFEFLLKQGWLYVKQDISHSALEMKVWSANVRDMGGAFEVAIKLAHRLDRRFVSVQYVTSWNRGVPQGRILNTTLDAFEEATDRDSDKVHQFLGVL